MIDGADDEENQSAGLPAAASDLDLGTGPDRHGRVAALPDSAGDEDRALVLAQHLEGTDSAAEELGQPVGRDQR